MDTPRLTAAQLAEEILIELRRILRGVHIHSRGMIKEHGLTSPQLLILREVEKADNPTLGNVARAVSLAPATLTGIVRRLEVRKLLVREQDGEDKRRIHIRLTDRGREVVQLAPPPLQEKFFEGLSELSIDEKRNIRNTLKKIVSLMGAEHIEAGPILDIVQVPDDEPLPDLDHLKTE